MYTNLKLYHDQDVYLLSHDTNEGILMEQPISLRDESY